MHGVIDHGEVWTVKQGLDSIKVEDSLQKVDMRLSRWNDLDNNRSASVLRSDGGFSNLCDVDVREIIADLVALDTPRVCVSGFH
mmetsp:Transcript_7649/g.15731  ORF Transcript_7649/g.15731 Transcript_7649/m.15731 type:complete len:84 (+) Transcript_7649:1224-1475(+)